MASSHGSPELPAGYSGDGGPATRAQLHFVENWYIGNSDAGLPAQLAADDSGNVYIADSGNYRIRRISPDGVITTIAGNGTAGFSGDGGLAIDAQLSIVGGLAVDAAGTLFFTDQHRVRQVSRQGVITTVAGTGVCGCSGDGGPAVTAALCKPLGLTFDSTGNLLIADSFNSRVRKITTDGSIATVLGKGTPGFSDEFVLTEPTSIATDGGGNLFIARTTVDLSSAAACFHMSHRLLCASASRFTHHGYSVFKVRLDSEGAYARFDCKAASRETAFSRCPLAPKLIPYSRLLNAPQAPIRVDL